MQTIGEKLRELRERENLLLRQVAAALELDTALLSKFETDGRKPSKGQILAFAKYYKVPPDDLLVTWLSDKLVYELEDEALALKAMQLAEEKIQYNKRKSK